MTAAAIINRGLFEEAGKGFQQAAGSFTKTAV
jgi:hypothetical protein